MIGTVVHSNINNKFIVQRRVDFIEANCISANLSVDLWGAWLTLLVMFIKFRIYHRTEAPSIKSQGYLQSSFSHAMKRSSTHQTGLNGQAPPNMAGPPALTTSATTYSFRDMTFENYSMNSTGGYDMPIGRRIVQSYSFPQDIWEASVTRTLPVRNSLNREFHVVPGRRNLGMDLILPPRFNRQFMSVPGQLNNYGLHNFRQSHNNERLNYPLFRQLLAREDFSFSNLYESPLVQTVGGNFITGRHLVQTNTEPETFNTIFNFIQRNMVDEGIVGVVNQPVWQVLSSLEDTSGEMSLEEGFVDGIGAMQIYEQEYDFSTESMGVEDEAATQDGMDD